MRQNRKTSYWISAAVFKTRGLLMVPPLAYVFLHSDARFEHSIAAWVAGTIAFIAGLVLRVAAQRHLRYRIKTETKLATTGPFRFVRNPVYLGNLAILTGLALMAQVPLLAPVLLLWGFIVYDLSVRFEELRLLNRFGGEYANYMKKTPRWIPRFNSENPRELNSVATWGKAFAVEFHCILLIVFPIAKEMLEWKFGGWRF